MKPITKDDLMKAVDLVGVHPFKLVKDEKGFILDKDRVLSAKEWLKEQVGEGLILRYSSECISEVLELIDEAFNL